MASGFQGPERYLLPQEVGVVVSSRIAALIYRHTDLARIRTELRGADAEADAVLMALHIAALKWRGSAIGTELGNSSEPVPSSEWITTQEAADMLDIGTRAVTKAITEKRLPAERAGRAWRIQREDLEHYRAARAA